MVYEEVEDPDEELSSLSEQESIRPRVNAKIVGKKRNFSFFISDQINYIILEIVIFSYFVNLYDFRFIVNMQ